MSRPLLLLLGAASTLFSYGQARMVFNNAGTAVNQHPFIVFNPNANAGTYLVIDNSNANAITQLGVTADVPIIKSEREENKIRWAIGNSNTGTYTIPFASGRTPAGIPIPLTVQVTSAGDANGSVVFSTFNSQAIGTAVTAGWNNDLYRPSDVTHMNAMIDGSANSENAIDRFWIIDPGEAGYGYTTRPGINISFGFDPVESNANGGNAPGLASTNNQLVAQRFNSGMNKWYDVLPFGTQTGPTVVSGVTPPGADWFRSWTLSNMVNPLPIQLVEWDGKCDGKVVHLVWTTASEQNNDYFTIEKSRDNESWVAIGTITGAGNSSQMLSYSFVDEASTGRAYYRLRQTDFDGATKVSQTIVAGCGPDNGTSIVNAWDDGRNLNLEVSSTVDGIYDFTLMDVQGKVLTVRPSQIIHNGITVLQIDKRNIATGIYVAQLHNSRDIMARRVHIH